MLRWTTNAPTFHILLTLNYKDMPNAIGITSSLEKVRFEELTYEPIPFEIELQESIDCEGRIKTGDMGMIVFMDCYMHCPEDFLPVRVDVVEEDGQGVIHAACTYCCVLDRHLRLTTIGGDQ